MEQLEQRNGGGVIGLDHHVSSAHAISLESFERRRGGLLDRRIEFLNRLERLSELLSPVLMEAVPSALRTASLPFAVTCCCAT